MVRFKLQAFLIAVLSTNGRKIDSVRPHKDGSFSVFRPDDKMSGDEFAPQVLKALERAGVPGVALVETGAKAGKTFVHVAVPADYEPPVDDAETPAEAAAEPVGASA